jgi:hypothetical protein
MALGLGMGMLLGGLGGGLLSGLGSMFGGEKGQKLQQGYDVVNLPQYSFTEPRLRLASDYLTQNIGRMSQGEFPVWWDKASPILRQGLSRANQQNYYGIPGVRQGGMNSALEAGAITGLGAGQAFKGSRPLTQAYMDKENEIDEYLTGLGVNIMQSAEPMYLQAMGNLPKGPDSVVSNLMGGVSSPAANNMGDLGNSLAKMAGQGWFNQPSGQGQTGSIFNAPASGMNWSDYATSPMNYMNTQPAYYNNLSSGFGALQNNYLSGGGIGSSVLNSTGYMGGSYNPSQSFMQYGQSIL